MSKVTHDDPAAGEPITSETVGTSTPDEMSQPEHAVIQYGGQALELKVCPAKEGAPGVEISNLLTTLGVITLDPGFTNTGSTSSAITYIDGDAGILRYRGYPIDSWPSPPASWKPATY